MECALCHRNQLAVCLVLPVRTSINSISSTRTSSTRSTDRSSCWLVQATDLITAGSVGVGQHAHSSFAMSCMRRIHPTHTHGHNTHTLTTGNNSTRGEERQGGGGLPVGGVVCRVSPRAAAGAGRDCDLRLVAPCLVDADPMKSVHASNVE